MRELHGAVGASSSSASSSSLASEGIRRHSRRSPRGIVIPTWPQTKRVSSTERRRSTHSFVERSCSSLSSTSLTDLTSSLPVHVKDGYHIGTNICETGYCGSDDKLCVYI